MKTDKLFTLITFDLKKIMIPLLVISSIIGVLNGLLARNNIQSIHQYLVSGGYGVTEYARWVVRDVLKQGYVTPTNLFYYWTGAVAYIYNLLGLLTVMVLGFILWKKESLELWLNTYHQSLSFVLFSKLTTFLIIIAFYALSIILSLYVYLIMMMRVISAELGSESVNLNVRLFSNLLEFNLLFWFLFVILAFGIQSVLMLLIQTVDGGFFLSVLYAFVFIFLFFLTRIPPWSPVANIRGFVNFAFFSIGIVISYLLAWRLLIRKQKNYES